MAKVSNPASLSSIKTVFGGGNSLLDYLRGGAYVPNTPHYSAISQTASGLAISQFSGIEHPEPAPPPPPPSSTIIASNDYFWGENVSKAPDGDSWAQITFGVAGKVKGTKISSNNITFLSPNWFTGDGSNLQVQAERIHRNPGDNVTVDNQPNQRFSWKSPPFSFEEHYYDGTNWKIDADQINYYDRFSEYKVDVRNGVTGVILGSFKVTIACATIP